MGDETSVLLKDDDKIRSSLRTSNQNFVFEL